jgi:hypothetical protein
MLDVALDKVYDGFMDRLRPQPFYGRFTAEVSLPATDQTTEPIHCQSCGARVLELLPCEWDTTLMVGACCVAADESPDVPPACLVTRHILDTVLTVGEMVDALRAHKCSACAHCEGTRDTVVSDRLTLPRPAAVCCEAGVAA